MTALPYDPARCYTVEEFAEVPLDETARWALQEGALVLNPRPGRTHMKIIGELYRQLMPQLPASLDALFEIGVHLEPLPATVRVPDLLVVSAESWQRDGRLMPSSDVVVAVEVLSPGTARTDTVVRPLEYADSGIEHFWLVDPRPPVTTTVHRLVDGHYEESQRAERVLQVVEPCPLRIDLDALLPAGAR